MSLNFPFKKESIDFVLETLAKKCKEKRLTGPINIYIVGGASIVLTFDYRKTTIDIDAYYESSEELSNVFDEVAKELELPSDWINKEFAKTPSYSEKIFNVAKIYSIYEDIIYVHVLEPVYIIAMKLKSSRPTGGDMNDIIRMIYELKINGNSLTYDEVMDAYDYLYDNDRTNTYDYFFKKTKEAFDTPLDDIRNMYYDKGF